MEYLPLYICSSSYNGVFFLFSVSVDIVCHKCGQTSRPVLRLRFRQVVTLKRTYVAVVVFWVFSLVSAIAVHVSLE